MVPLLRQARGLQNQCQRLGREAIERPEERPSFHALFRDVHAFSRGVGNPSRVTDLAEGLARLVSGGGKGNGAVQTARLLQEESVWQAASGSFVSRCRAEYSEAYVDVVTGICDAVEVTRTGLRLLAAAADRGYGASEGRRGSGDVPPLARLQTMLLSYPYSCCGGDASHFGVEEDALGGELELALRPEALEGLDGRAGAAASGAQHMTVLQVFIFRICFHVLLSGVPSYVVATGVQFLEYFASYYTRELFCMRLSCPVDFSCWRRCGTAGLI